MNTYILKISLTAFLVLLIASHIQSFTDLNYTNVCIHGNKFTEMAQDNEQRISVPDQDDVIYSNSLLLNGKAFDDENFDIHSRGLLTMVEGKPESSEARLIPFRVSRKRKGMLLEEHAGATLEGKYELNLSLLLAHSHPGDQLIIYPIRKEHCRAKRILRITSDKC